MKLNSCAYKAKLICVEENLLSVPKRFNLFIQQDNRGWYVSNIREIPGCRAEGCTMKDLMDDTREAVQLYFGDHKVFTEFIEVKKVKVH